MAMNNIDMYNQAHNVNMTKQQLLTDLKLVLSDVDALVRATADQGGAEIAKVRTKTADTVAAIKTRVTATEAALLSKAKHASEFTDDYVRGNPWRTLGIVTGVGLLIGLFIGRR
jgi:ElaB/YqjD/DUF883 family membrane-anchored ribosome-binding protein